MEQTKQYEYVDLGLPSGLKWAKCNVGATSETDYGDYFQWGSTEPNTADECNWADAPFNNGSDSYNKEYFNAHKSEWLDSKNNLKSEFDAARAIMGGDWRMPTEAEFNELLNGTTNEWFFNYNDTGVSGRKFTSKTDTSKYIFIPAAGNCYDGSVYDVGYDGYVWSSSLSTSDPDIAWYLYFSSGNCRMNNFFSYIGWPVRGVFD